MYLKNKKFYFSIGALAFVISSQLMFAGNVSEKKYFNIASGLVNIIEESAVEGSELYASYRRHRHDRGHGHRRCYDRYGRYDRRYCRRDRRDHRDRRDRRDRRGHGGCGHR